MKPLLQGKAASIGKASGKARIILNPLQNSKMQKGDVLVTTMTTPLLTPAILQACAIITDLGGYLSHAAIIARELGIPCVVNTGNATEILKDGEEVTIDGEDGIIYRS